jgi:hypothetical protein
MRIVRVEQSGLASYFLRRVEKRMVNKPNGEQPQRSPQNDPEIDFPIRETVEDYAGRERRFVISYRSSGVGYTVTAEEEGKEGLGYEFSAFSETSPYNALGELRWKMYRSLATRHITRAEGRYRPLHDIVRGRITMTGDGELLLVVDGIPLTLDDLGQILEMHEGWQFRLQIADHTEDISK